MVAIGDVLGGKFRVDRAIGEGAMGVVYEAHDVSIDRRVAVKVMAGYLAGDPEHRRRFEREARAVAKLSSPHVVHVLEVGEAPDGTPFYAMEYLAGRSLMSMVQRDGPLPAPKAVTIVLEALEALAEAHGVGLVHRDLKPDNLVLTDQGVVKVLDFGIVKDLVSVTAPQTRTGDAMGTPAYMAPEQVRAGEPVDPRTDIWAIGATLYELLAGDIPFRGESVAKILHAILNAPPAPIARPDVPPALEAVIGRCLAKKKEERYASARDLADALAPFAPMTVPLPRAVPVSASASASAPASASASASAPASASASAPAPAPAPASASASPARSAGSSGPPKALYFFLPFSVVLLLAVTAFAVWLLSQRPPAAEVAQPSAPASAPAPAPAPPASSAAPPPASASASAAATASKPVHRPPRTHLHAFDADFSRLVVLYLAEHHADLARCDLGHACAMTVRVTVSAGLKAGPEGHATVGKQIYTPSPKGSARGMHFCDGNRPPDDVVDCLIAVMDASPVPRATGTFRLTWDDVPE